jgi:THO complex subunit 1
VLEFFQTKSKDNPALKMLENWFEEDDDADLDNLLYTVEGLKLTKAAEVIKKMIGTDDE